MKYIIQLLQLREKVVDRMRSHIDKYNGSCYLRERLMEYVFDNKNLYRKKSNVSDESEYSEVSNNPQEGDVINTSCEEGRKCNAQMQRIVSYL